MRIIIAVLLAALALLPGAARQRERFLQSVMDAGFGDRVMFGSDQMVWPGVIEPAIAVINEAPFLSASQKRDILYNNAARFLRLTKADIDRHRGM